jgi:hypothetical protein
MLAVDIDITVEVSPQKLKHPTEHHAAFNGVAPENDCDITIPETSAVRGLRNPRFGKLDAALDEEINVGRHLSEIRRIIGM